MAAARGRAAALHKVVFRPWPGVMRCRGGLPRAGGEEAVFLGVATGSHIRDRRRRRGGGGEGAGRQISLSRLQAEPMDSTRVLTRCST